MSATTSDKVSWIVAAVLMLAMVIFVLWPSLRRKSHADDAPPGPSVGGTITPPAAFPDPKVDEAGIPAAGAPVDELGAHRQVLGAIGLNPAAGAPVPGLRLRQLYAPPI
jgi:hypothetical protein